jgi:hypothetical protein
LNTEQEMSRSEVIHAKGFNMNDNRSDYYSDAIPTEYKKIKVGVKNLDDAVLNLGSIKSSLPGRGYANKKLIMTALADNNLEELRNISNFYYNISGIYQRVCNYFAFLYRYDWYVVPEIVGEDVKEEKILKDFAKVLNYLDNSNVRKICGDIALSVIKDGAYYGYIVPSTE